MPGACPPRRRESDPRHRAHHHRRLATLLLAALSAIGPFSPDAPLLWGSALTLSLGMAAALPAGLGAFLVHGRLLHRAPPGNALRT